MCWRNRAQKWKEETTDSSYCFVSFLNPNNHEIAVALFMPTDFWMKPLNPTDIEELWSYYVARVSINQASKQAIKRTTAMVQLSKEEQRSKMKK